MEDARASGVLALGAAAAIAAAWRCAAARVGADGAVGSARTEFRAAEEMLAVDCITEEQWRQFDEEGWVKLSGAVRPEVVKMLQDRIDAIMLGKADVAYESMMMQLDSATGNYADMGVQTLGHKGATLNYRKIQNLDRDAIFMEYMRAPLFHTACRRVYGDGVPISSFRSMFFNKPAKGPGQAAGGTVLPWHQVCAQQAGGRLQL